MIESNANPPYDKAQALRLYVKKPEMDALVGKDMETYRIALEATGGAVGGVEPISRFHEAFQAPVDAAYAAAVVGLQDRNLPRKGSRKHGTAERGIAGAGQPKRECEARHLDIKFSRHNFCAGLPGPGWRASGHNTARCVTGWAGSFPRFQLLRAAVAEALGRSANAPITVEEMEGMSSKT